MGVLPNKPEYGRIFSTHTCTARVINLLTLTITRNVVQVVQTASNQHKLVVITLI